MVSDLLKAGVVIDAKPEEEPSLLMNIFVSWFPMLLLIAVWIFFMRQMQGGGRGGGAFSFGKSKARMLDESTNEVTFADVAGCEEAKEEVKTRLEESQIEESQSKISRAKTFSDQDIVRGLIEHLEGRFSQGYLLDMARNLEGQRGYPDPRPGAPSPQLLDRASTAPFHRRGRPESQNARSLSGIRLSNRTIEPLLHAESGQKNVSSRGRL